MNRSIIYTVFPALLSLACTNVHASGQTPYLAGQAAADASEKLRKQYDMPNAGLILFNLEASLEPEEVKQEPIPRPRGGGQAPAPAKEAPVLDTMRAQELKQLFVGEAIKKKQITSLNSMKKKQKLSSDEEKRTKELEQLQKGESIKKPQLLELKRMIQLMTPAQKASFAKDLTDAQKEQLRLN